MLPGFIGPSSLYLVLAGGLLYGLLMLLSILLHWGNTVKLGTHKRIYFFKSFAVLKTYTYHRHKDISQSQTPG